MSQGRLKIFRTLQAWLAEYRLYRRDEHGDIVKENDHLMDATRYLVATLDQVMSVDPGHLMAMGKKPTVQSEYDPYQATH